MTRDERGGRRTPVPADERLAAFHADPMRDVGWALKAMKRVTRQLAAHPDSAQSYDWPYLDELADAGLAALTSSAALTAETGVSPAPPDEPVRLRADREALREALRDLGGLLRRGMNFPPEDAHESMAMLRQLAEIVRAALTATPEAKPRPA